MGDRSISTAKEDFSFRECLAEVDRYVSYELEEAYTWCSNLARSHYENFPVASFFLPRRLRPSVAAIYAFARVADDIADEPGLSTDERVEWIRNWRKALDDAHRGRPSGPIFTALAHTVETYQLPITPFLDLLEAFRFDCDHPGFESRQDLLDYCEKSAQPVGRLILHLFGEATDSNINTSDSICTGLQLINFWQDISRDAARLRVTIPRETLQTFSVSAEDLRDGRVSQQADAMMAQLVSDARRHLLNGKELSNSISSFRLRRQIRSTLAGGLVICDKVENLKSRVFRERPTVGRLEAARLLLFPG